jgi:hypothetical protein
MKIGHKRGHSLSWAVSPAEEEEEIMPVFTSSLAGDTTGNARSYISFDAGRRWQIASGYDV